MKIRHTALLSAALVAFASVQALNAATIVNYTTSGIFGSSGTSVATYGSPDPVTVTYTPTSGSVTLDNVGDSTNASVGTFTVVGPSLSTTSDNVSDTFTLTINQSAPGTGNGSVTSKTFTGKIKQSSSNVNITWDSTAFVDINGVRYTPLLTQLVPITTQGGTSTMQATIELISEPGGGPTVPLPAAAWGGMGLMGLLGGVQALRRRSITK